MTGERTERERHWEDVQSRPGVADANAGCDGEGANLGSKALPG